MNRCWSPWKSLKGWSWWSSRWQSGAIFAMTHFQPQIARGRLPITTKWQGSSWVLHSIQATSKGRVVTSSILSSSTMHVGTTCICTSKRPSNRNMVTSLRGSWIHGEVPEFHHHPTNRSMPNLHGNTKKEFTDKSKGFPLSYRVLLQSGKIKIRLSFFCSRTDFHMNGLIASRS